jgi:sulfate transport system substrate-binding protein
MRRLSRIFKRPIAGVLLAAAIATALPGGLARAARPHDSVSLTLAAYSTPQAAYTQIIPAFQKTKAGAGVTFSQSYGASGDQSRAVKNGLQADIVAFALEPDINSLVKAGLVASNWYKDKYHGLVTKSTVVFAVRKGNPKHIKTWADLIRSNVEVLCPNVFQSGGARWDIMAAYGAQRRLKKTDKQAIAYLTTLYKHIVVQDKSDSASLATFQSGKGDVLVTYENEAIGAQQKGVSIDYVVPPQSIQIENPVAVTKITKHAAQANAFVSFLYTPAAQKLYAQNGFWSVIPSIAKKYGWKKPKTLFTIRDYGSWPAVMTRFFDPANGVIAQIERNHGLTP